MNIYTTECSKELLPIEKLTKCIYILQKDCLTSEFVESLTEKLQELWSEVKESRGVKRYGDYVYLPSGFSGHKNNINNPYYQILLAPWESRLTKSKIKNEKETKTGLEKLKEIENSNMKELLKQFRDIDLFNYVQLRHLLKKSVSYSNSTDYSTAYLQYQKTLLCNEEQRILMNYKKAVFYESQYGAAIYRILSIGSKTSFSKDYKYYFPVLNKEQLLHLYKTMEIEAEKKDFCYYDSFKIIYKNFLSEFESEIFDFTSELEEYVLNNEEHLNPWEKEKENSKKVASFYFAQVYPKLIEQKDPLIIKTLQTLKIIPADLHMKKAEKAKES